ncbi:unnamed protein product [Phyllotreta striolata]|uniref:Major facilitator superfamily (MFS) profile domain-containing protein n=1 Tax=Phyllotreta striolata TaxID=444603 RepID=A0A9N9XVZ8_PHYSR|nr:unnamed protein product [Phyllotreta striolata]
MDRIRRKVNLPYISSITANILFFCMGATVTWISPVATTIEKNNGVTNGSAMSQDFLSSITSLPTVGAAISAYFYTHIADKFGRKIAILSIGMPYLLSYFYMSIRRTVRAYLIARFVLGLAIGGTFSVIPIYAGEISNKHNRATLNSIGGIMLASGGLFSYVLGNMISIDSYNLILLAFPAVFFPLFSIFGEETAHFYMFKNQRDLAKRAMIRLRGSDENVDTDLDNIQKIITDQAQTSMLEFIKKKMFIKVFTSVVGLLIFQQLTGINAILMFNETIYELTESEIDSTVCCVIVGIVQFFSSILVLTYEERFGRRTLLITSAFSMSVLLGILGVHRTLAHFGYIGHLHLLPLVVLSLFVISYFVGIGPIPFVILSEILPWRVKCVSVSIVSTIYWNVVFVIVNYFAEVEERIGLGMCFLSLAVLCLISVAFVYFFVEETKGKTFEEIQEIY